MLERPTYIVLLWSEWIALFIHFGCLASASMMKVEASFTWIKTLRVPDAKDILNISLTR